MKCIICNKVMKPMFSDHLCDIIVAVDTIDNATGSTDNPAKWVIGYKCNCGHCCELYSNGKELWYEDESAMAENTPLNN